MSASVGVTLPQWTEEAGPGAWRRVASTAEEAGFESLWKGDHVTFPETLPGGGVSGAGQTTSTYDVFTTLSFLAGCTEEITLGTNVCVVPYRRPVVLAKVVLSLDALSGGRFEFGVGAGWLESEFEVLGVSHGDRGALTTEFLDLFERVCANGVTGFDGPFHSFLPTGFYPRPVRGEGPTVWVGGDSSAALRRVARFGEGWTVVGKSPDEVNEARHRLLRAWDDYDRTGTPRLAVTQQCRVVTDDAVGADDAGPLVGTPDQVAAGIEAYADAGATRVILRQRGLSTDERVAQLGRFAEDVRPLL